MYFKVDSVNSGVLEVGAAATRLDGDGISQNASSPLLRG